MGWIGRKALNDVFPRIISITCNPGRSVLFCCLMLAAADKAEELEWSQRPQADCKQ